MKKLLRNNMLQVVFVLLASFLTGNLSAQTSVQDFGTVAAAAYTSSTGVTTYLPNPTTSGTTYARGGAIVPNAPILLATASNPLGTTGAYVRGTASSSTSISRFSPMVCYTGSTEFYTSFKVLFGDAAGGSTAGSGIWTYWQGSGSMYSSATEFTGSQVFVALRFTYGAGNVTLATRQNTTFSSAGLTTSTFNQATVYNLEIVANNKSSGTISYNYAGTPNSVAVGRYDLYMNGTLVGDDLQKSELSAGANVASNTFSGVSSTSNVANIFVDDVTVYNAVPAFINVAAPIIPGAPVVSNPQINSLDVNIDSNAQNGNGATIQYAIQETTTSNYVQADGTLGASPVWQTAATWGTVSVNGLNSNTLYTFSLNARNAASVESGFGATASGTTLNNTSANLSLMTPLGGFGSICTNVTATDSFMFDGANLNGSDIVVGSLEGYSYSLTQNGTYTPTLNISYVGASIDDQVVWVKFAPSSVQSYNGNIALSGGGLVADYNVAATGSGINTSVNVTTGSASGTTAVQSTFSGSLVQGCTSVTAYGIEYSTTNGFTGGTGTQVAASNLSAGAFSSLLTGLAPNTPYYVRAYAADGTGTVYGSQQSFTTGNLPAPDATEATSVTDESFTANWTAVPGATSYALDVKTDPFLAASVTTPWINEFHYDNSGANDTNEFVEIVVPDAYTGTNLTLTLYNGNGGGSYATVALASMTLVTDTPAYNIYQITTATDGIQNGAPDGFSLSDSDGLIQFLSYEGVFTATNGPANGVTSTDVGVSETNTSNVGASLHLVGTGTNYGDFTWAVSSAGDSNTKGNVNTGQTINAAAAGGVYIIEDLDVGNVTSYQVNGLMADTVYYYRVRAVSANGLSANSDIEDVTTLLAPPTFGAISQVIAVVCDGSDATFNVVGLLPDATSILTFNINNGTPQTVNVAANGSGFGTFDYMLVAANNGQTLTVTSVDRADAPGNPLTVTTDNTVSLSVNAYVTYYRDFDNDTYGNPLQTISACDGVPAGYVTDNTDCDDNNAAAHAVYAYYEDHDGDGYGSTTVANICAASPLVAPTGFSTNDDDCNDAAASAHPGAAEIGYNLVDDDCDGSIDEGFPPKITVVQGAQCNSILAAIDTQIVANLVAGAQGYRWRVTTLNGPTAGQVQELDTALRVMKLTQLLNYAFDTQYKIEVGVYFAGFLQPYNASNCTVSTPATTTQLTVCGQNLTSLSNPVYASLVPYVAGYRFRITDPITATNTQVIERPIREFRMTQITNFIVQYNKSYNVEVSLKNTDGTWLPYGQICSVTTPAFPTTSLQDSQCEDYAVPNSSTQIYAFSYPGAIAYVFQITGPGIVTPLVVTKSLRAFTLGDFPGLLPGATYNVKVRLVFNVSDPAGPFGKTCTIVTPGAARQIAQQDAFDVTAYPNPFADSFTMSVTGASGDVKVRIYDMTGRLLDDTTVKAASIESFQAGSAYPSGVYNVIVTQGDNAKTLRLIKR